RLGYHRYWVAEHHAGAMLAGPSREVLIGPLATATERIRVGSGGVMLPHYSPFKVAESFSVLAGLFPGRVGLGLGRAAGTAPLAPVEEALRFLEREGSRRRSASRRMTLGDPDEVRAGLEQVAADYRAQEVIVVTITHDHAARRRSYEAIAAAFGLDAAPGVAA